MKCHYEGTGCLEGQCMGTKEIDQCIGYERCSTFRPYTQTNADRIRAMSDEELARTFAQTGNCPPSSKYGHNCERCGKCWLDYLRQPVKDGEDDG